MRISNLFSVVPLLLAACNSSAPSGVPKATASRTGAAVSAASTPTSALASTATSAAAGGPDANLDLPVEDEATAAMGEARAKESAAKMVGKVGPMVTVKTLDHGDIDLGTLLGKKPIYLKFWATWCGPCLEQMPAFEAIHRKLGKDLLVLAVNTGYADNLAAVKAFQKREGLTLPIAIDDGTLADLLDLSVTPQHVLIGRDGRIAFMGHVHGPALEAALAQVLTAPAPEQVELGAPREAAPVLKPGEAVGDLKLTDTSGKTLALGGAGKARGLVFFSPWCESYLAESRPEVAANCKRVRELVEAHAGDSQWLSVADRLWATDADLKDFQETTKTSIPVALDADGKVFRAFGVRDIPAVALIDAQGKLVRVVGPADADLAAAIDAHKAP